MKPDWSCILFDLDGTIADSAPGITATLAHMFEALELPVPAPAELLRYVGPPILDAFRDFAGFSPEKSAHALKIYREEKPDPKRLAYSAERGRRLEHLYEPAATPPCRARLPVRRGVSPVLVRRAGVRRRGDGGELGQRRHEQSSIETVGDER